jgi:hypothetical protein
MNTASFSVSQPMYVMAVFQVDANVGGGVVNAMSTFAQLFDSVGGGTRALMFPRVQSVSDQAGINAVSAVLSTGVVTYLSRGSSFWWYAIFDGANSVTRIFGATEQGPQNVGAGGINGGVLIGGNGNTGVLGCTVSEMYAIPNPTGSTKTNSQAYILGKYGI